MLSQAGGALGLVGAFIFLARLGSVPTGLTGNLFFGGMSILGLKELWFLSIGFWLAIVGSIIMLIASPTSAATEPRHPEIVTESSRQPETEREPPLPISLAPTPAETEEAAKAREVYDYIKSHPEGTYLDAWAITRWHTDADASNVINGPAVAECASALSLDEQDVVTAIAALLKSGEVRVGQRGTLTTATVEKSAQKGRLTGATVEKPTKAPTPTKESPLEILELRLAKGEITMKEYTKIRKTLEASRRKKRS
jgi:uncharacterized membrane protein